MVAKWRNHVVPREQPLRHTPVVGVGVSVAATVQSQAGGVFVNLKNHIAVGLDVVQCFTAFVHGVAVNLITVHVRHVAGVDATLHRLQPIGVLQALGHKHVALRQQAPLQFRRGGLFICRAHVSPQNAAAFNAGVAFDVHARARLGGRWHIHALAHAIKLDAVVCTADAVFFVATKKQRHTSV